MLNKPVAWISLLLLDVLTIGWVHKQLNQLIPKFKKWWVKAPTFVVLLLILVLIVGQSQNSLWWDTIKVWEIKIKQWTWDPDLVRDFSQHVVLLMEAYRDAFLLEKNSYEIQRWDMSPWEYQDMIALIYTKWDEVYTLADGLEQFKDLATDEVGFLELVNPNIFAQTYAMGISTEMMMWQEIILQQPDSELSPYGNERIISQKIVKKRKKSEAEKRNECDAIKQANPKKRRIEIIQEVFKIDASNARMRARDRHQSLLKATTDKVAREDSKETYYILFQNGIKVWVFLAAAPAALAAWGWALAASSMFIWWVDVAVAVGKTVDIVFGGKKPTQLNKDRETANNVVWTISLFSNVKSLYDNKKLRDPGNYIFVADMGGKMLKGGIDYVINFDSKSLVAQVYVSQDAENLNYGNPNGGYGNQELPIYLRPINHQTLSSDESLQITLNAIKAEAERQKKAGTLQKIPNKNLGQEYESIELTKNRTDRTESISREHNSQSPLPADTDYQAIFDNTYVQTANGIKRAWDLTEDDTPYVAPTNDSSNSSSSWNTSLGDMKPDHCSNGVCYYGTDDF